MSDSFHVTSSGSLQFVANGGFHSSSWLNNHGHVHTFFACPLLMSTQAYSTPHLLWVELQLARVCRDLWAADFTSFVYMPRVGQLDHMADGVVVCWRPSILLSVRVVLSYIPTSSIWVHFSPHLCQIDWLTDFSVLGMEPRTFALNYISIPFLKFWDKFSLSHPAWA